MMLCIDVLVNIFQCRLSAKLGRQISLGNDVSFLIASLQHERQDDPQVGIISGHCFKKSWQGG